MRRFLHDYALSLSLFVMFAASLLIQWLTHDGSTTEFVNAVMENWQSEMLQLAVMVVLTAYLIHRGSPQSKDGDEETRRKIDSLQLQVRELRGEVLQALRDDEAAGGVLQAPGLPGRGAARV